MTSRLAIATRAVLISLIIILSLGCGEKEVDLSTPEGTIRTYVRAYNMGNKRVMRMCGMATDMRDAFTKMGFAEDGSPKKVNVDGIQCEILKSIPGKVTVTRMFTTRTVTLIIHLTSKFDRDYDKVLKVRLQCRRTAYDEEDVWTIL